jgi:hypothetical protein
MILEIYLVLIAISVIMILIGLIWSYHSEYTLIGFIFMFLLGLMLSQGSVTYKIGSGTNTTFSYNDTQIIKQTEIETYNYSVFNDTNSHLFGIYLCFSSAAGFVITLTTLTGFKWGKKKDD